MKYIANGKRHQQEIGARRWRPCLIKTNCRWARIFFLTENRLKLPSETLLQQSESTRAHGGRWRGGYKNTSQETKDDCTRKKRTKKKNKKTHPSVCNSKAIIAHIVLIYLKVRGGQVVFWMLNISEVLQASNSILKLRPPPPTAHSKARLRTWMTPPAATSLMSQSPFPYTNQQQIPIYLFLHHHSGKLLCKWHSSLSLSCKYNVIGDVNNPFVCLTRSSRTPPVSLIQLLRFREWGEWRLDLKAARVNDIQIDHCHMLLWCGPFKSEGNEKRSSPLWRA